jgi:hypothetical protein
MIDYAAEAMRYWTKLELANQSFERGEHLSLSSLWAPSHQVKFLIDVALVQIREPVAQSCHLAWTWRQRQSQV